MPAIIGLLLPGVKLLTRVPFIGVILCALGFVVVCGITAVALALRLGGLVLRVVVRGPLIGVPLLAVLMDCGLVPAQSLPLTRQTALELAQRGAIASACITITGITPAQVADAARQIGEYAMEALPQLVSSTPLLPAQHRTWVAVAHTGGEGAYLRAAPRLTSPLQAWADDTRLEVVGEDASGARHRWKRVRDPRGQLGWIAAEYVVPTTAP